MGNSGIRNVRFAALALATLSLPALACDPQTGTPRQQVIAIVAGAMVDEWSPALGELHALTMPDGFRLGIQLDAPEARIYGTQADARYAAEMVRISLFQLGENGPPQRLASTYGGTSSLQGYGPRGGADTVEALGPDGIELLLSKSVCVDRERLAASAH